MMQKALFKLSAKIVLLFFFTSSYLSATHIHPNEINDDADCEICIVVKNIQNISLDTTEYTPVFIPFQFYLNILSDTVVPVIVQKGYLSTAPPLFLFS